ncbi:MAG: chromate transporter [Acidobacteriota bacterium]
MTPVAELARLFLKLGTTAFGGPAAHIAMMHDEVVRRRGWLSADEFLDLVGAANLIPGPNSTELAIHIGHRRAGWRGLMTAGVCFILPAALIVTACAWAYVRYGSLPQAAGILYGVKPVIIAIVMLAVWDLARSALKTPAAVAAFVVSIALAISGVNELLILLLAALGAGFARRATMFAAAPFGLWPLFLFFAKVGSVLYGSGYVLLAFLRSDLVERWHWLSEAQLLDAIAVGQFTPGPVFTTATFIGYLLGGLPGAVVATIGIFAPAFFFVAISGPLVPRIRKSPVAGAALNGVNAASLALMAVVTWDLGRSAVVDPFTILLALASFAALFHYKWNSAWLVAAGAVFGLVGKAVLP